MAKARTVDAQEHLRLAKEHLARVLKAWDPPDWSDLSLYGFYCLENAITASALHAKIGMAKTHQARVDAAKTLATAHAFPDVSTLLIDLNDARKATAYGDVEPPELSAEDVVRRIETYVEVVEKFLAN